MSMRRSGEHAGHDYRCWVEQAQGKYRGWYRGKMNVGIGGTVLVDRLHGSTVWHESTETALDEAESRIKAIIDEVVAELA